MRVYKLLYPKIPEFEFEIKNATDVFERTAYVDMSILKNTCI